MKTGDTVKHDPTGEKRGIPYSVTEARLAAQHNVMDEYHRSLILWLCDQIEAPTDKEIIRELLEALELAICEVCECLYGTRRKDGDPSCVCDKARTAIAKAEGR